MPEIMHDPPAAAAGNGPAAAVASCALCHALLLLPAHTSRLMHDALRPAP